MPMPTKKKRVAGYLSDDEYDALKAFAQEKGITESKALNLILSEYFGLGEEQPHPVVTQDVTRSEFDEVVEKVTRLGELLDELKRGMQSNQTVDKPKSKPLSSLPNSRPDCPRCGSGMVKKDGMTASGEQRYRCKSCSKSFTA